MRLSGWCTVWIGEGGGVQKREKNRIVLCFKSLEWLMAPRVVSLRLDWFSYRYFHDVSLRRFLWSVHTCSIFCLNRWLGDFYDCFDSQIFYIVPNSDILGVNGGISKSNLKKKIWNMIHDGKQRGILRIYFWLFFVLFGIFLLLYFIFSHNSYYVIIRQMQHTVLSELITCFLLYKKF